MRLGILSASTIDELGRAMLGAIQTSVDELRNKQKLTKIAK